MNIICLTGSYIFVLALIASASGYVALPKSSSEAAEMDAAGKSGVGTGAVEKLESPMDAKIMKALLDKEANKMEEDPWFVKICMSS